MCASNNKGYEAIKNYRFDNFTINYSYLSINYLVTWLTNLDSKEFNRSILRLE